MATFRTPRRMARVLPAICESGTGATRRSFFTAARWGSGAQLCTVAPHSRGSQLVARQGCAMAVSALGHERRGRLARRAAHVRPVVGCPGAIAVVGDRPARRREVGSVGAGRITLRVATLGGECQE